MSMPPAEVTLTDELVTSLVASQHPDLAHLSVKFVEEGWDNALYRLGDELLVRLPRRLAAVEAAHHEHRWLVELGPQLSLPIPVPLRLGGPSEDYPWPWSIVPWFIGVPGDLVEKINERKSAMKLGRFLKELHQIAPFDAPSNPWRGVALSERTEEFDRYSSQIVDLELRSGAREAYAHALNADAFIGPKHWIHGDLHPANALFVESTLNAIIDFSDLCAGDPATDLAGGWMMLSPPAIGQMLTAYEGSNGAMISRARGWAALFGVLFVVLGQKGRVSYGRIGARTLTNLTKDQFGA